jgi:hypothetical protein
MNDDEGQDPRDPTWQYHFALRDPGGKVRKSNVPEWLMWRRANGGNVPVQAFLWDKKCGAFISFTGFSEHPDRPTEFWNCTATAHFGPHDGSVWFSKFSSESEAIEKARWLVEYFAEHGRFPDGPELNLSGSFPKKVSPG